MKRKAASLILATAMTMSLLAGCGSTASTTATEATTQAAETTESVATEATTTESAEVTYKGEITMMHYSTQEEIDGGNAGATTLVNTVDNWVAKHPDITLSQNVLANKDYKPKIATLAASDSLPDVFFLQGMDAQSFSDQGLILDLTQYVDASPYKDKYDMSKFYPFTKDDKYYAIPAMQDGSCTLVAYNAKAWEAAGYSEFPKTWDEVISAQSKLEEQGYKYAVSFANGDAWQGTSIWLSTFGDRFTGSDWTFSIIENTGAKFTDKVFVDALQATNDVLNSGVFNPDYNSASQQVGNDAYVAGLSAAAVGGNWDAAYIKGNADQELIDNTKFAVLPQPKGATGSENTHATTMGYGLAINAKVAEDPEKLAACIDLIETLSGPEYADYLAENFAAKTMCAAGEIDLSKFDQWDQDMYNYYENPGCSVYDTYIDASVMGVMNSGIQAMLNGSKTAEELAAEIQAKYEEVNAAK